MTGHGQVMGFGRKNRDKNMTWDTRQAGTFLSHLR